LNDQILQAIDAELARLQQARNILASALPASSHKPGRKATAKANAPAPRRKLSAKARKAIADAQRKRWAKVKSQKKATGPSPAAKKGPEAG